MIKDLVYEKSEGEEVIEIFVDNIWIPAMATDLRIMNKEAELVKVTELRIRKFEKKI